ncbi:hypothetical protein ACN56_04640 [Escherichia coli]|nr:hypothetical protein ACN56_04640 [Escherichia coli]
MLPGYFRFVCQNGCVCGQSLGEVRVPHRGNVVDRVIEGAYEVVGVFDRIEEKRDAMQSLRRAGEINGEHVPEIILLNSHDGTSSYQMLPGYFRFVCQNGCVCGQSLGEVRVPHRGNVVDRVIEGAYEVVGVFDRIEEKRDAMQSLILPPPARQALAQAALTYRYGDEHQPVTTADILTPRRREDYGKDLWSAYQTIQENMLKGGISGRSAKGKRIHTRAIHSIDTDIKLNRALWVMAETLLESLR